MKLVIVESPTKANTIGKFLGPTYKVESSYGHVRDLPKSKLGIDLEKNYEPQYIIPTKARKRVTELRKLAAKSDEIILASDEDREGEAIAWHIGALLKDPARKGGKSPIADKPVSRIVFHEITKSAIEQALEHPRTIDKNLVDAQQSRRVLDRLVGYKLSPFLWKKVAKGLSAGRVQSVALRLIVDRENEIRKFKPEEYWTIDVALESEQTPGKSFEAGLFKIDTRALEKFSIGTKEQAEEIKNNLLTARYQVLTVKETQTKKNPAPPFTTSTLQQHASSRLRLSAKKTMMLAQSLYENGLITYMRTDSVNLSAESIRTAKEYLEHTFGKQYALADGRVFKGKSKLAQEAHEAIRPTGLITAEEISGSEDEKKLYRLIWQRFLASQMPAATFDAVQAEIEGTNIKKKKSYFFRANGTRLAFDGFLKVYPQKFEEKELPKLSEGENLQLAQVLPAQHFTEPPPRYTEARLIKTLEEYGIGRPSTYVPIISVIQSRNYVKKEEGKFLPTEIGEMVIKLLIEHFPNIVDANFTAELEEKLDRVAEGKERWRKLVGEFYEPFDKLLESKYKEVEKTVADEKTDEVCEKCGKPMLIKFGRFGKFLACSGFPDCRNTKPLQKAEPKKIGLVCPKCKEGDIVERWTRKGRKKIFWGCSRYPDCDYATWENPLNPVEKKKAE